MISEELSKDLDCLVILKEYHIKNSLETKNRLEKKGYSYKERYVKIMENFDILMEQKKMHEAIPEKIVVNTNKCFKLIKKNLMFPNMRFF